MAQRTVCICNGKAIGIETIYSIVNGQQINIPEKIESLRIKSRSNKLFCPCGCGSNLILVAGDRKLREQHFRLKDGKYSKDCNAVIEGKVSINSKIVLKCWLDDKLKVNDIESRVPIHAIDDSERKYEFSFLSRSRKIAVSYCKDRRNLSDEKFDILENNSKDINIIYVVNAENSGSNGQYPEGLMKIQNRQGYCLLLKMDDINYYQAELKVIYFMKNLNGLWIEITICNAFLSDYEIKQSGDVLYCGEKITDILEKAIKNVEKQQNAEQVERDEIKKRILKEAEQREIQLQLEIEKQEKEFEEEAKKQAEKQTRLSEFRKEERKRRKGNVIRLPMRRPQEKNEVSIPEINENWILPELIPNSNKKAAERIVVSGNKKRLRYIELRRRIINKTVCIEEIQKEVENTIKVLEEDRRAFSWYCMSDR